MRRVVVEEVLDQDGNSPEDVRDSLFDLRRINRSYGGTRTLRMMLQRVAHQLGRKEFTVLDIAAATGDVLTDASRKLKARGVSIKPTFADVRIEHLKYAPSQPRVVCDALVLPFATGSFDLVACSLFLHHLEPYAARAFAREALRVSKQALLINDLRRSRLHLLLNYLALPTFHRITRTDSLASVRRSYTRAEASQLIHSSGAPVSRLEAADYFLFRFGLIAWKKDTTI